MREWIYPKPEKKALVHNLTLEVRKLTSQELELLKIQSFLVVQSCQVLPLDFITSQECVAWRVPYIPSLLPSCLKYLFGGSYSCPITTLSLLLWPCWWWSLWRDIWACAGVVKILISSQFLCLQTGSCQNVFCYLKTMKVTSLNPIMILLLPENLLSASPPVIYLIILDVWGQREH